MTIFDDPLSNMVPIADTATDADSPNSALLMDKLRVWLEALTQAMSGKFGEGSATDDPPNDTTGQMEDTGASFEDDEHNNRRIVFTSGAAIGQDFLIDDTVAGSDSIFCTGDNLYSAGVRSGDTYVIVGNFRNSIGHTHDGHNARNFIPYLSKIGTMAACTANELSNTANSATAVITTRVYIPQDPLYLYMHVSIKTSSPSYPTYCKFNIDGNDSNTGTTTSTSYVWVTGLSLDISGLSEGFYTLTIYLWGSTATLGTYYLNGYDLFIT